MKKNFMLIVALVAVLLFAAPMTSEAADTEGKWQLNSQGWWYELSDGSYYAGGMYEIEGEWYYFDAAGYMKTGWVWVEYDYGFEGDEGAQVPEVLGDWYYFNDSGAMAKGWVLSGSDWYYMDPEVGFMWTNMLVDNGAYYVGNDGTMVKNYYLMADQVYAYDANGNRVVNGWFQVVEGNMLRWAFVGADGQFAEGWLLDGGAWYYLDEGLANIGTYLMEYEGKEHLYKFGTNGALLEDVIATKGWIKADSDWYYYGDEGLVKDDWVCDGGAWYWMEYDGAMAKSCVIWDYEAQCNYVIGSDGKMVRNQWVKTNDVWSYTDGTWIYADDSGKPIEDQWLELGGTWYYFAGFSMVEQPIFIDGQLNLFHESGAWLGVSNVTNGWIAAGYSWYYLENGQFATGWRLINDVWYWFSPDSYLAVVDGVYWDETDTPYLFNAEGALTSGWYLSEEMDIWFYADAAGVAAIDWKLIDGTWYYFDIDGWMMEDGIYYLGENEMHIFADNGAWLGAVNVQTDGWHNLYGSWYYMENGDFVYGLKKDEGQIYMLSPNMLTDDFTFVYIYHSGVGELLGNRQYMIAFDEHGHLVRNQWKYFEDFEEWVWFDGEGYGTMPEKFRSHYYG